MPTIHQLDEVFNSLPEEPKGPTKKLGPQYERPPRPQKKVVDPPTTLLSKVKSWFTQGDVNTGSKPSQGNPMGALRNGDKGFVAAVNDSGNTGWIRFGRSGFADAAIL
jgi:tRNA-splicing endonuclease subunit Sen54